ncbi:MAG TPA: DUF86 domain-containing protein [Actinomycetota bacterium]|nr:DUF86 domain-containing protein [Actinomycetota bacterium]
MLEAIDRIQSRTRLDRGRFQDDELLQTYVVHHLEILGEAARAVSPALREHYPDLPWRDIVGMRNVLVHEYFGVDADRVWATVVRDLPMIRSRIEAILEDLEGSSE